MTARGQREVVIEAIAFELGALDLGHPVRVAVDGITGVGKTTFANELADATRARGRECLRVTMDGFHHPRATRYRQGRESPDGYYEDAYGLAALRRELLDPLGPSGSRRYRTAVIDLATDEPVDDQVRSADEQAIVVVDGSFLQRRELDGAWDLRVFLRASFPSARARGVARDADRLGSTAEAERIFTTRYHAAQRRYLAEVEPERRADVVIEHTEPHRPTIRSYRARGASSSNERRDEARAFFGPRAAGWNERFEADGPAIARAVGELGIPSGATVLDVGCGAGRALVELATAVGPRGAVVGLDVTEEMLQAARAEGATTTPLVLADAPRLPVRAETCDVVFAAGLISHLANPVLGLVELARVSRTGARLALFHPVGRAALARKHGRPRRPDDPLDPGNLPAVLAASGWRLDSVDDGAGRYLALATRTP